MEKKEIDRKKDRYTYMFMYALLLSIIYYVYKTTTKIKDEIGKKHQEDLVAIYLGVRIDRICM